MAQSAIETRKVSSMQNVDMPYKAISTEYNFTSLSKFKACVLAGMIAAPLWISIAYILAR